MASLYGPQKGSVVSVQNNQDREGETPYHEEMGLANRVVAPPEAVYVDANE